MFCLQGASAVERILREFTGKQIRAFIVWEPVLPTDWGAPSSRALHRISDLRAAQFWDKQRLISHSMGEQDRNTIVWDRIIVYGRDATWNGNPPEAVFSDGPVVKVLDRARAEVASLLGLSHNKK